MTKHASDYTLNELMTTILAHDLRDDETGFIGVGTGGRAYQLAVGMPFAAALLARITHAPRFHIIFAMTMDPRTDLIPDDITNNSNDSLINWPSGMRLTSEDVFHFLRTGKLSVGFVSGAQIDQYGNINICSIGDYKKPKTRLVGNLLQTELMAFAKRNLIVTDLNDKRGFVPKVDFINGFGYGNGGEDRQKYGLPGGGPSLMVTNLAVLDFAEDSRRLRVKSLHPGVTAQEVQDQVSFELVIPKDIPQTTLPTEEEVELLRNVVDPKGIMIGGKA